MGEKEKIHNLSDLIIEFYEKLSSWEHSIVASSGITLQQMHTIEILGVHNPVKMKDLAGKMGITTGTLTVLIDNLEKKDLVNRIPNPDDRRSIVIVLTEKGREHYRLHSQYHRDLTAECVAGFSASDIDSFSKYLKKVVDTI